MTMGALTPEAKCSSSCISARPCEAVAVNVLTPVSGFKVKANYLRIRFYEHDKYRHIDIIPCYGYYLGYMILNKTRYT